MKNDDHIVLEDNFVKSDNLCEECKKEDKSVKPNLIMFGYKIFQISKPKSLFFYQIYFVIV